MIDTDGDVSDRVLTALLARLDTEPALVGALLEDPAAVLQQYGLPDEDVEPLITWLRDRSTGDPDVVARRVAGAAVFAMVAKLRHGRGAGHDTAGNE